MAKIALQSRFGHLFLTTGTGTGKGHTTGTRIGTCPTLIWLFESLNSGIPIAYRYVSGKLRMTLHRVQCEERTSLRRLSRKFDANDKYDGMKHKKRHFDG